MTTLLPRVKSRMNFHARRLTRRLLDGDYASVYHGHSLDFDDLREYVPGDEIRDIDWKASARHSTPLVKRYVAHRRHALMLVVNTGVELDASSAGGELKRELAILMAGMAGYLAVRHGDDVSMVYGSAGGTGATDSAGSEAHLENILRTILHSRTLDAGDINTQLSWVARNVSRRKLLFVISDAGVPANPKLVQRLSAQHDFMWVTLTDADLIAASHLGDLRGLGVGDDTNIPKSLLSRELQAEYERQEEARQAEFEHALKTVSHVELSHTKDTLHELHRLMKRHANARQ